MDNIDTEILFPLRVIPSLLDLRSEDWHSLVEFVIECDENSIEKMGFVFMMVRLGGCVTCNSNSFRAMRGCTDCAQRTIKRYREGDAELRMIFNDCCNELKNSH